MSQKAKTRHNNRVFKNSIGAPWRIRTVDLGIRSPLLYPTELMEHKAARPSEYKFTRPINYNLLELVVVRLADLIHRTIHAQVALLNPNSTLANALNLLHGMRNEQDRDVATLDKVLNAALTLLLEKDIANRKRLIDD